MNKVGGTIETAMRVALLPKVSVDSLRTRFQMSAATAHRWVNYWYAAKGLPRPERVAK